MKLNMSCVQFDVGVLIRPIESKRPIINHGSACDLIEFHAKAVFNENNVMCNTNSLRGYSIDIEYFP